MAHGCGHKKNNGYFHRDRYGVPMEISRGYVWIFKDVFRFFKNHGQFMSLNGNL